MKTFVLLITALAFAITLSPMALAVEKKEKKSEDKKVQSSDSTKAKKSDTTTAQKTKKKKYDDFIDLNKNGIDDRCESRKAKKAIESLKKETAFVDKIISDAKKAEKKETKSDSAKTKSDSKKEVTKEKKPK